MNRFVTVALLLAALGGGLYWFLSSSKSEPNAKPPPTPQSVEEQASPLQRLSPATIAGPPLQREMDPKGSLRLEGQVIDEDEKGVAGAAVAISSVPPRFAQTEGDGSFVFEGLGEQEYRLEAHLDGLYAPPLSIRLKNNTEPTILRMRQGRRLLLRVLASDGAKPVADAEIEVRSGMAWSSGLSWSGRSDSEGKLEIAGLPPSEVSLVARAKGYATYSGRLPGSAPGGTIEHQVGLQPGVPVYGQLIDTKGVPVAGARVAALPAGEPFPLVDPRRDGALSDKNGDFKLPDQRPGSYRFVVLHEDLLAEDPSPRVLSSTSSPLRLVATRGAVLEGRVVDSRDEPVAGAEVAYVMQGSVPWRTRRGARSDEQGRFRFRALPQGEADVVATGASAASEIQTVTLEPGQTSEVALTLSVSGRIHGLVVDKEGEPVPEAQVLLEPMYTGALGEHALWQVRHGGLCLADGGGVFEFTGLPVGNYQLRATAAGMDESSLYLAPPMPATPSPTQYQLLVAPEVAVSGRLLYQDGVAVPLFHLALASGAPLAIADTEGRFAIRVPAGEHRLHFSGPSFAPTSVTAKAGADMNLGSIKVDRGRSIAGTVVDASGQPVEAAEVAAGALLTGDGSKLFIDDESILARSTTTDTSGRFALNGFGAHAITVVAGLKGLGRSRALQIPAGLLGADVTLSLEPVASLQGRITREGQAIAETVVIATPIGKSSPSFVVTGVDGSYAFDALPPGEFMVYPMLGGGGSRPKDMFIKTVQIRSEATSVCDIKIPSGVGKLEVSVVDDKGAAASGPVVVLADTGTPLPTAIESVIDGSWLRGSAASESPVAFYLRQAVGGPAVVEAMPFGSYQVCVARQAAKPGPPEGPLRCQKLTLRAGADAGKLTLQLPAASDAPTPQ